MLALSNSSESFKRKKEKSNFYSLAHVFEHILKESANAPIQTEIVDRTRLTDQWPQVGRRGGGGFRFRRFRWFARREHHDHSCSCDGRLSAGHVLRTTLIVARVGRFHTSYLQLGELSAKWKKKREKEKS